MFIGDQIRKGQFKKNVKFKKKKNNFNIYINYNKFNLNIKKIFILIFN